MFKRFLAAALVATGLSAVSLPAEAASPPNVVLIYTDDMRADDMEYMDYTRGLFELNGTIFRQGISPQPLCCPARAHIMTGQYAHNSGVYHNDGPYGGMAALEANGKFKLTPQWFKSEGYETAYVGKYLNGYQGGNIAGVDYTETISGNVYAPYDFKSWNNGDEQVRSKHTTIWTGDRTANLIGNQLAGPAPFFTIAAFLAPHRMKKNGEWVPPYARGVPNDVPMPVPPRQYTSLMPGDETPPSIDMPSWNEADMSDKPAYARQRPMQNEDEIRAQHKARVLSLYAVDDAVKTIVDELKRTGEWSNTVLLFTSDNGYGMGEHRHNGKDEPYLSSLRVPMMMMGPGVPHGISHSPVTTVDIPKTLAALANVSPNRTVDGMNMLNATPNRTVLIQSGSPDRKFDWRGIYTPRYTYVEHYPSGEIEFYDRQTDPHELDSNPNAPETNDFAFVLDMLRACSGSTCQATHQ